MSAAWSPEPRLGSGSVGLAFNVKSAEFRAPPSTVYDDKLTTARLDTQWEPIALESEENPASGVRPENAAIIIYTSGSTGRPKGAVLAHRGLVNYTEAANEAYSVTPADHVLQFGSISFDLSAEEIFPSLTTGAKLVPLRILRKLRHCPRRFEQI